MLSCAPFVESPSPLVGEGRGGAFSHPRAEAVSATSPGRPVAHLDIRAGVSLPVRLGSQALGQVLDRDRVSILGVAVSAIEQLEKDVGHADRLQRAAKGLGAEV